MPSETEVLSCPSCKHLVRVPADWLGQTVQCPECQATFTAPIREGDRLTEATLLSAPASPPPVAARPDPILTLPAFGLMLVGAASFLVNGYLLVKFLSSPDRGQAWVQDQLPQLRKWGLQEENAEGTPDEQDARVAAELAPRFLWVWPAAMTAGAVTFAGGVAMLRRKAYRLAQVGCLLAAVNLPHLCCIPGAVFGLWGLLMLMSDERPTG
jgi:hypothetical protein